MRSTTAAVTVQQQAARRVARSTSTPPPSLPSPGKAGVSFTGELATGYRANLWLRSAIRVLQLLAETVLEARQPAGEEVRGCSAGALGRRRGAGRQHETFQREQAAYGT